MELPDDIQSYLIMHFGPKTVWPTEPPASTGLEWPSATATTNEPEETSQVRPSSTSTSESATETAPTFSTPTTLLSSRRPTSSGPAESSLTSTILPASSTSSDIDSSATPSTTLTPDSPPASNAGLSKTQKIGLGLGIPFGLVGAAALFLGCCALLRRRQKRTVDGSIPPSSPGFIPRFAFQERSAGDWEHRTPLNRDAEHSTQDLVHHVDWEDDGVDPMDSTPMHNPYVMNTPYTMNDYGSIEQQGAGTALNDAVPVHHLSAAGMTMHDPTPIMAPALFHTHSSNRARGMRTSYTSLRSVAEVTEPDEKESPILGRQYSSKQSPSRKLLPTPPIPTGATIKRKPLSVSPPPLPASPPVSASPAANAASRKLLRQTMPEHSGSSSSGLALTSSSGFNSNSSGLDAHNETASPVSPISNRAPSYPFNYDSYIEDYGPEYQGAHVDVEDGLYGGHTSLSRYPESRRKNSKTEWPLRNIVGSGHRRKSSGPMWDRIYEE